MTTDAIEAVGISAVPTRLRSTGETARELNISRRTLQRWLEDGIVEPSERTAGGHYRWDVHQVREQVRRHLDEDSSQ